MLVDIGLLADPKRIKSELGQIMHNSGKMMMRHAIDTVYSHYEPVIQHKNDTGWMKDHVKSMWDKWKSIETMYDNPTNDIHGGWQRNPDDRNRQMFTKVVELACLMCDEDSAYDIPFLVWLKQIHEDWPRMEISANQAYGQMNFGNMYKDLIEVSKPLPMLDDKDPDDIDYKKLEQKLMVADWHPGEEK